jgi:dihydrodipicolinate synthase/N-acetylneuraminate lyase
MKQLKGVVPVLLTPFDKNGEIDNISLAKLVEHLNTKEIGGFWVLGTGAEDMNLTYSQRLEVVNTVVKANKGQSPLVVGAGFFSMKDSLNFMDDTAHLDFDAYHVLPYHNLISLDRVEWMYKAFADHANKPLWMYTSANWGKFIAPDFIESMKDYPNIAGVKFSTSNLAHTEKVIEMQSKDFQVLTAVVKTFYPNLCLGVKAATTVDACPYTDLVIEIYRSFQRGDLKASLIAQRQLNRFLEQMPDKPGKDNFLKVAEGKYVLSKKGICEEFMSGYYRELTLDEKNNIDQVLEKNLWINN